jgi:very-short-patch-repair endonuclease
VLEDRVLDLILAGGFRHPDVDVPLPLAGRTVIPDFRRPDRRLTVEADGAAYHQYAHHEDGTRQALLEGHGERLVRITHHHATARRAETLARLREAGAPLD